MIDPPVGPFSKPSAIKAWIQRLERLRALARSDNINAIDCAIDQARAWLNLKENPRLEKPEADFDFDQIETAAFARMLRKSEEESSQVNAKPDDHAKGRDPVE